MLGYQVFVDYVKQILQKVGYKVSVQFFLFIVYYLKGLGSLSVIVLQLVIYEWEKDFIYLLQIEVGDVIVKVVLVDLFFGVGNIFISGCEVEDFVNFLVGLIVLIQCGICNFEQKVENVVVVGVVGVIIFNQGNIDDCKGLENVIVGEFYEGGILVIFVIYDNGVVWLQILDLQLYLVVDVVCKKIEIYNVVVEICCGNLNNVVMVGVYFDLVFEGFGINDNGLGSVV